MKKHLLLLACSLGLFACTGENEIEDVVPSPVKLPINIGVNIATRATDTAFEKDDKVGIYVVNYSDSTTPGTLAASGNHATNVAYTFADTCWTATNQLYWADQTTKADFYGYYPHTSTIANVSAHAVAVLTDQSSEANYKSSDILWGKKSGVSPTSNAISLNLSHVMSNIIIYLTPGKGYTDDDLANATVTITGLKTTGTLNLATGAVTPTGTAADIKPKSETGYKRALIIPQSVNNAELIKVTVGSYSYTLTQSVTFESNKQIKCTLTVNKVEGGLNIGISGWETSDVDYGGTVN
jgi:cytochrome c-type biogenesis protein CcmE